jgi:hypothetical protein
MYAIYIYGLILFKWLIVNIHIFTEIDVYHLIVSTLNI